MNYASEVRQGELRRAALNLAGDGDWDLGTDWEVV